MLNIAIVEFTIESRGNLAKRRGVLPGVFTSNEFPRDRIANAHQ